MSTAPVLTTDGRPKELARIRQWLLAAGLGLTVLLCWMSWPYDPGVSPYELSTVDGKARFYRTHYSDGVIPSNFPNLPIYEKLLLAAERFKRRYIRPTPAAWTFPPQREMPCSITSLLDECMDVSAKQYLIAVEIRGAVQFGYTNTLNGLKFVKEFERALQESGPVDCYDYAKKCSFKDSLLLIREGPRLVKVVPRSKLAEYQQAGLVKASPEK